MADGGGEAASRVALSTLAHLALHFGKWNLRIDQAIALEVMERVERFYRQVDGVVTARRPAQPPSAGMQTTLTAVYSVGNDCFFAHVGHLRLPVSRRQHHAADARSHAGRDLSAALMTRGVAADLQHIHRLHRCGGGQPAARRLERLQLLDDNAILVCTNGVTDMLPERDLESVLARDIAPAISVRPWSTRRCRVARAMRPP